ncbi:MAG: hypothetical protein NT062_02345 [Proteobacteria bacterium]|nr:hypothetical protein [Pseudomonadota bacterium]
MTITPELGERADVLATVRAWVEAGEREVGEQRERTGARVLGRRGVLEQSWRNSPMSIDPRRNLRPRFAGGVVARVTALLAHREFLAAYRGARTRWLLRQEAMFPHGTYWLARFAGVPVAPS